MGFINWGGKKKVNKKIKLGLPETTSPRVIFEPPHGNDTTGRLHLRIPLNIQDCMGFDEYRRKARVIIKDMAEYEGMTDVGLEELLAAMVYELIDQRYTGG